MNALVEEAVIKALYAASQCRKSRIDLSCPGRLRPAPEGQGVSDRIRVRSIVGRFLEHHRIWYFSRTTARKTSISPAPTGWAGICSGRIEVAFPVLDPELKGRSLPKD
jgi:polyphosphate kinase